jgi:FAD/FMN-containing dehydrogenase
MVIDLMHLKDIDVYDKTKHLVRVGAGAIWVEIGTALQKHGLALSSGDTRTVGVGGLTLGGGVGWMLRKYGLAIDSLAGVEIVTASGQVLHAAADENEDLFWAIRGGGGNFGIVTQFEFAAHPVGQVFAGPIVYGLDDLPTLLRGWRDAMRQADENLTTMLITLPSFMGNPPAATVVCCYADDDEAKAAAALEPLKHLGKLVSQDIQKKAYVDVLEDAHVPSGVRVITRDGFVKDFSDELIDTIAGQYTADSGPILQIRSVGGAMNRVAAQATAFAHRDKEVLLVEPFFVPPDAAPDVIAKALQPWKQIEPFLSGAYGNLSGGNHDEDISTIYPPATYERLAAIKRQYDPDNLFSQNFNVKPAA